MPDTVIQILSAVRDLAVQYYDVTGKPLGVTGEIAEYEAARLLNLELCEARQSGFDALKVRATTITKIQIKGRRIIPKSTPGRLSKIDLDNDWDSVMLVLLDERYSVTAIYEAERPNIEQAIKTPGSKARNVRGALSVSKFKSIGERVWP